MLITRDYSNSVARPALLKFHEFLARASECKWHFFAFFFLKKKHKKQGEINGKRKIDPTSNDAVLCAVRAHSRESILIASPLRTNYRVNRYMEIEYIAVHV